MNTLQALLNKPRADGWWYPWLFVGGMLLVVAVNGVMAAIALSTWTGLETEDYYERGLAYNEDIRAAAAQKERGWKFDFAATPVKDDPAINAADLRVVFADKKGNPLDRLEVRAMLVRPTQEGFDRQIALDAKGGGVYEGRALLPLPGQWSVRILAFTDDFTFQEVRRIVLR